MERKDTVRPLIIIAGPTASGKSELAVEVARLFNSARAQKRFGAEGAEIISADSRQVYKGMNIGTGKITKREMKGVPHHLLDIADPKRIFTVAHYQKLARKEIARIWKENKVPVVCGGTGLYIRAAVDGIVFPEVRPDRALRARLGKVSAQELFSYLKKKDPARAKTIDPKNPRRLIRALEIAEALGKVPELSLCPLDADILFLGIRKDPQELERRIRIRLHKRLRHGMIEEITRLHEEGVSWKRMDDLGLEYRYGAQFLQGKITREAFEETLAKEICRYAKRQMTWFKRDFRIIWVNTNTEAIQKVEQFIKTKS